MSMKKNFVTILTPKGVGAIAVIRLRGEGVDSFLAKHFSKEVIEGRCVHGEIRDGGVVIDDAVVVRSGEFVDLNVHGGVWVVKAVLELAERTGFEIVEDAVEMMEGETILEKEVMAGLKMAGTELAIRVLLEQSEAWKKVQNDDVPDIMHDRSLRHLLHPPQVAIVGIANVGKSTLANQLFARERSIVADLPGTTRDWVGEMANLDGLMVMLVDTPGMRKTEDEIEHRAIEGSQDQIEGADLVILVVDPTQAKEPQIELMEQYNNGLVVANKSDRVGGWEVDGVALEKVRRKAIHTVATTGKGMDQLREAIKAWFWCEKLQPGQARAWTARQYAILYGWLTGERSLNEIWEGVVEE